LVTSCVGNAFFKYVIEGQIKGRIDVTGRRGRRRKQPLERNILHIISSRKAKWVGYLLRRKCLLKIRY